MSVTIDPKYDSVKDIIEVALLGFTLSDTIKNVLADGKISWTEYLDFLKPIKLVPAAFDNYQAIPEQLKNPNVGILVALFFEENFKLENNEALREWVIECVKTGLQIYQLAATFPKKV